MTPYPVAAETFFEPVNDIDRNEANRYLNCNRYAIILFCRHDRPFASSRTRQ